MSTKRVIHYSPDNNPTVLACGTFDNNDKIRVITMDYSQCTCSKCINRIKSRDKREADRYKSSKRLGPKI